MSKCSCILGTYDFSLDQTACSDIIYQDRSVFQTGADFVSPPTYTLSIEDSGGKITEHKVTVGVPLHLDLSCASGVYKFTVVSCTEVFYKYVAIVCQAECGYLRAVAKLGRGVEVEILRSIRERIEYVKQAVGFGDIETARDLLKTIDRDISMINCSCKCE